MKLDVFRQIRFRDATRAMKALLNDPDDTAQVFRIIDALSGKNGERTLKRLRATESGKYLLEHRPSLLDLLTDQEALKKLPEGSLGREYLSFLSSEGITAEGLRKASLEGRTRTNDPEFEFFRDRMRDTHDLWHTVTGYKGDLAGEASLLAFSVAQTKNPGVAFIVCVAWLRGRDPDVRRLIEHGFLRGRRAEWLVSIEWEKLLPLPLSTVRRMLNIDSPPVYQPIRVGAYQELRHMAA